jgi:hypothetical protein
MKKLILINLNQKETSESLALRNKERVRWFIFGFLLTLLVGANSVIWYIGLNYNKLINQKTNEISQIKKEISLLREKGKNLSKQDIMTLATLENNRFLWAENLEYLGELTPEDISLTELKFKKNKLNIKGIATTYSGQKDFEQVERFIRLLKSNNEFSKHFTRMRLMNHELINVRGQDIVSFELEAPLASIPPISQQIHNFKFTEKSKNASKGEKIIRQTHMETSKSIHQEIGDKNES